jgi:hypothetical protein
MNPDQHASSPSPLSATVPPARIVSDELAEGWAAKATRLSEPLISLAGPVGDPAPVSATTVTDSAEWMFGNFMLAWLDSTPNGRFVRHLPDASFFLQLLRRTYSGVFDARPDLEVLLDDDSRPEMSVTNDVLQIQLRSLEPGYSMIRHHALMLFTAALWLDEPRRSQWLDLYDSLVTYVDERPQGRPSLEELAQVEAGAFADFVELAPQTLDAESASALLASEHALDRILDYQLYAAVAIGLEWRDYRDLSPDDQQAWFREHLSELYLRPDYLEQKWTENA